MHAELQQLLESVLPRADGSCERAGRFDGQSGLSAPRPGPAEWDGRQRRAYLAGYHQGRAGWLRYITPDTGGDELLVGDCLRGALTEARSWFSGSEWAVASHGTGLEIARYLGGQSESPQGGTGNVIVREPAGATLVSGISRRTRATSGAKSTPTRASSRNALPRGQATPTSTARGTPRGAWLSAAGATWPATSTKRQPPHPGSGKHRRVLTRTSVPENRPQRS